MNKPKVKISSTEDIYVTGKFAIGERVEVGMDVQPMDFGGKDRTVTTGIVRGYSVGWNPPLVRIVFDDGKAEWIREEYVKSEKEQVVFI